MNMRSARNPESQAQAELRRQKPQFPLQIKILYLFRSPSVEYDILQIDKPILAHHYAFAFLNAKSMIMNFENTKIDIYYK